MEWYSDILSSTEFWALALICILSMGFTCWVYAGDGQIHLNYSTTRGRLPIKTWKSLRDASVEKQDKDYSCGAAAVATILRSFYNQDVYEKDVLGEIARGGGEGTSSFSDLERAVDKFGFKAAGFSASFDNLRIVKIPSIVYLRYRNKDHFSVIRGIDDKGVVWLGDPSWGNRKFTMHQFKAMWETRSDDTLKGKYLLIIPKDKESTELNKEFFYAPALNSIAIQLLTLRR